MVVAGVVQLNVSARYHHRWPGKDDWRHVPAYIVSDDKRLFQNLRAPLPRPYQPASHGQASAPLTSPAPATFVADVGIGWKHLGKGRWTWRGTFVGSYLPPTKPTSAQGTWVGGKGWTADPRDSRRWAFRGSFDGPSPPSPPGPQSGSFAGFAGGWVIDKKSLTGATWTWHGTWTGQITIP
jgi:hypothetical protein